jgi:glycosyltransferase involved in cell wall biosynthesis
MSSKTLKILQVIDTLNVGGGERVFVDMCNILKENDENIEVLFLFTPGKLHNELNNEICFNSLDRKSKWSFSKMYECSLYLKQNDVIHCHFRHVYKYIALICFVFRIKSKIILHDHYGSIDVNKKIPFLFKGFLKPKLYIGVSNSLCEWAFEFLKINKNEVFLLQNIILKTTNVEKMLKQKDLILVSNIKPIKNNQFAIDIVKKSKFSLMIVGRNQDDEYFNELVNKKSNLNVEINQKIQKTQPIFSNFKLGLHTSVSESGPLVLIEYLAQGLPFLAYETGEVAKVLKPYFPEYFIDNFDVDKWIERIEMLIETPKNSQFMDEVFEKHFSKKQYYQKLKDIYYG